MELLSPRLDLLPSFRECLDAVARERIYIEMLEAPTLEKLNEFWTENLKNGVPATFAFDGERIVGWADIIPNETERFAHRGSLGMGVHPDFRGRGLGRKLLEDTLRKARDFGLEKVDLRVYTSNTAAIELYRKLGFREEGTLLHFRKLDGRYFDVLAMGLFFKNAPKNWSKS